MAKLNTISALKTTLFLLAYIALTACGTKGPLYIPEQRYPQKEDAQTTPQQTNPTTTTPSKEY